MRPIVTIRTIMDGDVPACQELLSQLGYSVGEWELRQRCEVVLRVSDHTLMLAEHAGGVVALCHLRPPSVGQAA